MARKSIGAALVLAGLLGGCLGEPPVEERWTHLEILSMAVPDTAAIAFGDSLPVQISSRVTFRDLFTGFLVGEIRVSQSLSADSLYFDADEDPVRASEDVHRLLAASAPVARGLKGLAGFPQLIRRVDFEISTRVPAFVDGRFDPPGGPPRGLFLVLYMGDGEEIELEDGRDSVVVTPFVTRDDHILAKAIALPLAGTGGGAP